MNPVAQKRTYEKKNTICNNKKKNLHIAYADSLIIIKESFASFNLFQLKLIDVCHYRSSIRGCLMSLKMAKINVCTIFKCYQGTLFKKKKHFKSLAKYRK